MRDQPEVVVERDVDALASVADLKLEGVDGLREMGLENETVGAHLQSGEIAGEDVDAARHVAEVDTFLRRSALGVVQVCHERFPESRPCSRGIHSG